MYPIAINSLTFSWPDGSSVLDNVTAVFPRGCTGVVGANGSGKSTLLRLIAGELSPQKGSISVAGRVAYLPQLATLSRAGRVSDLMGLRRITDAIRAIEAGSVDPAVFDVVGDHWDIEARALAALDAGGVHVTNLDRSANTLSGGEAVLTQLVSVQLRGATVGLLDEPTNNLDAAARDRVYEVVREWRGTLLVVSHDHALLDLMDSTAELRAGNLQVRPGSYSEYLDQVEHEQRVAESRVRQAEQQLKAEKQQQRQAEQRIARSRKQGKKDAQNRKFVPAVINDRRNSAEKSQGHQRGVHARRVMDAQEQATRAGELVRSDDHILLTLPDPDVPRGRDIARVLDADGREFLVRGPERIGVVGVNGSGKSTLLRRMMAGLVDAGPGGEILCEDVGYLPQFMDGLDDDASVLENVRRSAADVGERELKNQLARLLLRGDIVERPVRTLSGGERFRAAIAQVLLASPPPQLVMLDEPTNNLDRVSKAQLCEALRSYRGALVVVSHDRGFLNSIGVGAIWELHADGCLTRESLGN